ncbi:hypothetical protein L7F22_048809 [Adiantum nelumboides]|nr:hypothetical protein [Adiantum nelumboides]
MQGIDVHPGSEDVGKIEDVAHLAARIATIKFVLPTAEQAHWDVKDAHAHALIALSVKRTITPHICSAKSAKQAWDIMAGLYAGCNEAKIALPRKELESKIMNEEDDMDIFLAGIKDVNKNLFLQVKSFQTVPLCILFLMPCQILTRLLLVFGDL